MVNWIGVICVMGFVNIPLTTPSQLIGRDHRLQFYAPTHSYRIDGAPSLGSVTGLIHAFSQDFHAPTVIARMRRSRNWPRPGYLKSAVQPHILDGLRQMPAAHELLRVWECSDRDEQQVCHAAQALARSSAAAAILVDDLAKDDDEIITVWDVNRQNAAMEGTYMHWHFEVLSKEQTGQQR